MRVLTLNIHKGYTVLNARFMLHELREAIREVQADLVFLQEVQGEHTGKAGREADWPDLTQYEFLADQVWNDYAYGKNAAYQEGHHGNAILSHYPIMHSEQVDISTNPIEQRGFLFCEIDMPDVGPVYGICVHLGLSGMARRKQLTTIGEFVQKRVPSHAPLLIAGDTNDWTGLPTRAFCNAIGVTDAFKSVNGSSAKSFPAFRPMLPLDRIFVRGFDVDAAQVYSHGKWAELSDHAALLADVHPVEREAAR